MSMSDHITQRELDKFVEDTSGNTCIRILETLPSSTLLSGTKTTTAGNAVAIASSTSCKSVLVQAKSANTGTVKLGNSSLQYIEMTAGDSISIDIDNLNKVYIDVTVDNEGINYVGVA